ncbi:MAG: 3-oxoacyl-ACP synthase III [Armatimonadetes bacterium]|nr:3-oxoacyl-ACP synthase III [Armatimonadota bacterium]
MEYELPPYVVSTESIFEQLRPMLERIKLPTEGVRAASGIEERRFWDRETTIAQAATLAARKALEASGLRSDQIGCLISTSVCKDYIEPSMASLVHGQLGLSASCLNFDIGNACLAFMNGVSIAAGMIEKGQIEAAMLVDAESARQVTEATIERLQQPGTDIDQFRRHFAALTLGSGSVAVVLTHRSISRTHHRVVGHVALADTRHRDLCLGNPTEMIVHTRPLLEAGVNLAARTWKLADKTFGWTAENIDLFVCHQVGATHHRVLFESLGLDTDRSFVTYPFLGNVGPASVPLTLALARDRGRVRKGARLALMGIGSGLNCSMMEVRW